jgi:hypothetical protein
MNLRPLAALAFAAIGAGVGCAIALAACLAWWLATGNTVDLLPAMAIGGSICAVNGAFFGWRL